MHGIIIGHERIADDRIHPIHIITVEPVRQQGITVILHHCIDIDAHFGQHTLRLLQLDLPADPSLYIILHHRQTVLSGHTRRNGRRHILFGQHGLPDLCHDIGRQQSAAPASCQKHASRHHQR